MPGGLTYSAKVGKVFVTELVSANTWYQVLTKANAHNIRGFKIKSRYTSGQPPNDFDYAFNSTPSAGADTDGNGFYSMTGSGAGDTAAVSNGLWARSNEANTFIEVMTYE